MADIDVIQSLLKNPDFTKLSDLDRKKVIGQYIDLMSGLKQQPEQIATGQPNLEQQFPLNPEISQEIDAYTKQQEEAQKTEQPASTSNRNLINLMLKVYDRSNPAPPVSQIGEFQADINDMRHKSPIRVDTTDKEGKRVTVWYSGKIEDFPEWWQKREMEQAETSVKSVKEFAGKASYREWETYMEQLREKSELKSSSKPIGSAENKFDQKGNWIGTQYYDLEGKPLKYTPSEAIPQQVNTILQQNGLNPEQHKSIIPILKSVIAYQDALTTPGLTMVEKMRDDARQTGRELQFQQWLSRNLPKQEIKVEPETHEFVERLVGQPFKTEEEKQAVYDKLLYPLSQSGLGRYTAAFYGSVLDLVENSAYALLTAATGGDYQVNKDNVLYRISNSLDLMQQGKLKEATGEELTMLRALETGNLKHAFDVLGRSLIQFTPTLLAFAISPKTGMTTMGVSAMGEMSKQLSGDEISDSARLYGSLSYGIVSAAAYSLGASRISKLMTTKGAAPMTIKQELVKVMWDKLLADIGINTIKTVGDLNVMSAITTMADYIVKDAAGEKVDWNQLGPSLIESAASSTAMGVALGGIHGLKRTAEYTAASVMTNYLNNFTRRMSTLELQESDPYSLQYKKSIASSIREALKMASEGQYTQAMASLAQTYEMFKNVREPQMDETGKAIEKPPLSMDKDFKKLALYNRIAMDVILGEYRAELRKTYTEGEQVFDEEKSPSAGKSEPESPAKQTRQLVNLPEAKTPQELAKKIVAGSGSFTDAEMQLYENEAAAVEAELQNVNQEQVNEVSTRNTGLYGNKPIWGGVVNLQDGQIEEVITREQYEEAANRHGGALSPNSNDLLRSGEAEFFFLDANGEPVGDWHGGIKPFILGRIKEQIKPNTGGINAEGSRKGDQPISKEGTSKLEPGKEGKGNLRNDEQKTPITSEKEIPEKEEVTSEKPSEKESLPDTKWVRELRQGYLYPESKTELEALVSEEKVTRMEMIEQEPYNRIKLFNDKGKKVRDFTHPSVDLSYEYLKTLIKQENDINARDFKATTEKKNSIISDVVINPQANKSITEKVFKYAESDLDDKAKKTKHIIENLLPSKINIYGETWRLATFSYFGDGNVSLRYDDEGNGSKRVNLIGEEYLEKKPNEIQEYLEKQISSNFKIYDTSQMPKIETYKSKPVDIIDQQSFQDQKSKDIISMSNREILKAQEKIKSTYPLSNWNSQVSIFRAGDYYYAFDTDAEKIAKVIGPEAFIFNREQAGEGSLKVLKISTDKISGYLNKLDTAKAIVDIADATGKVITNVEPKQISSVSEDQLGFTKQRDATLSEAEKNLQPIIDKVSSEKSIITREMNGSEYNGIFEDFVEEYLKHEKVLDEQDSYIRQRMREKPGKELKESLQAQLAAIQAAKNKLKDLHSDLLISEREQLTKLTEEILQAEFPDYQYDDEELTFIIDDVLNMLVENNYREWSWYKSIHYIIREAVRSASGIEEAPETEEIPPAQVDLVDDLLSKDPGIADIMSQLNDVIGAAGKKAPGPETQAKMMDDTQVISLCHVLGNRIVNAGVTDLDTFIRAFHQIAQRIESIPDPEEFANAYVIRTYKNVSNSMEEDNPEIYSKMTTAEEIRQKVMYNPYYIKSIIKGAANVNPEKGLAANQRTQGEDPRSAEKRMRANAADGKPVDLSQGRESEGLTPIPEVIPASSNPDLENIGDRGGNDELPGRNAVVGQYQAPGTDRPDLSGSGENPILSGFNGSNVDLREVGDLNLTKGQRKTINYQVEEILKAYPVHQPELYQNLTPDALNILRQYTGKGGLDYESSADATQFYTVYSLIDRMYRLAEKTGLKIKKAMEPAAGAGNFVGMRPGLDWTLVELDYTNSGILPMLYPQAEIFGRTSFEEIRGMENAFDLLISNAPFLEVRGDKTLYPELKALHNFYMVRMCDLTKPGGIIANIVTKSVMDASDITTRKMVTARANVLGCFRLPEGYFRKNSGTDVTTDIIFLQKRPEGVDPSPEQQEINEAFVNIDRVSDDLKINSYYRMFPDHLLGELIEGKDKLYGGRPMYQLVMQGEVSDVNALLDKMKLNNFNPDYIQKAEKKEVSKPKEYNEVPDSSMNNIADFQRYIEQFPFPYQFKFARSGSGESNLKEYNQNFTPDIVFSPSEILVKHAVIDILNPPNQVKLYKVFDDYETTQKVLALKRIYQNSEEFQNTGAAGYRDIGLNQIKEYQRLYKTHPANDPAIKSLIKSLPNEKLTLELLLTSFDKDFNPSSKFLERARYKSGKHELTPETELSIRALANEDEMGYIHSTGLSYLSTDEFPQLLVSGYAMTSEGKLLNDIFYYSGEIYDKIDNAQAILDNPNMAKYHEFAKKQLEKLEAIKPTEIKFEDISFAGTEDWLNKDTPLPYPLYYTETKVTSKDDPEKRNIKVIYHVDRNFAGEISSILYDDYKNQIRELQAYGHYAPRDLFEKRMNGEKLVKRSDRMTEEEYIENYKRAEEIIELYKTAIRRYIGSNPKWKNFLQNRYNRLFNGFVELDYMKGSYLIQDVLEECEKNAGITFNEHQRSWVVQAYTMGVSINAQAMGAGKTYGALALGYLLKKRGIARKICYVAEGKNIMKFAEEARRIFGKDARILVVHKLPPQEMTRTLTNIANNNYDAVIMTQQTFESIPLSEKTMMEAYEYFQQEIEEQASLDKASNRDFSKIIDNIRTFIENVKKDFAKNPPQFTFEQTGFDCIIADEAHAYKNLPFYASVTGGGKLGIEFGVGSKRKLDEETEYDFSGASRAFDFRFKCDYITMNNNGKNVYLLTGTPTPNKPMEFYTMIRHLGRDIWAKNGIENANTYYKMFHKLEQKTDNPKDSRVILTGFENYNALRSINKKYVDYRPADTLGLKLPIPVQIRHITKISEPVAYIQNAIRIMFENLKDPDFKLVIGDKEIGRKAIILPLFLQGRVSSVDPRLFNPTQILDITRVRERTHNKTTDKVEQALDIISNNYKRNPEGGQLVFLDMIGKPPSSPGVFSLQDIDPKDVAAMYKNQPGMATYLPGEVKYEIMERTGLSNKEVMLVYGEYITNPKTGKEVKMTSQRLNETKYDIQTLFNEGKVKVIIGNILSMGQGMDLNKYTSDVHFLNLPYTSEDLNQALSRGRRQGNVFPQIRIHYYLTQGTWDMIMMELIQGKEGWISQLYSMKMENFLPVFMSGSQFVPDPDVLSLEMQTDPVERWKLRQQIEVKKMNEGIVKLAKDSKRWREKVLVNERSLVSVKNMLSYAEQRLPQKQAALDRLTPKAEEIQALKKKEPELYKSKENQDFLDNYERAKREVREIEREIRHHNNEIEHYTEWLEKNRPTATKLETALEDATNKQKALYRENFVKSEEVTSTGSRYVKYTPREPNEAEVKEEQATIPVYEEDEIETIEVKPPEGSPTGGAGKNTVYSSFTYRQEGLDQETEHEVRTGRTINTDSLTRIQMPELIKMLKELTGNFPKVRKTLPKGYAASLHLGNKAGSLLDAIVQLSSQLMTKNAQDVNAAETVLAHEIGHLCDWLHRGKFTGNLLQKLFLLQDGVFKRIIAKNSSMKQGEITKALARRRAILKALARRRAIILDMINRNVAGQRTRYSLDQLDKMLAEIENKVIFDEKLAEIENKFIFDEKLREELTKLTFYWSPPPPNATKQYLAYRMRPSELYADFVSALLNSPETAEQFAPDFFDLFFNQISAKQEFAEIYNEVLKRYFGEDFESLAAAREIDITEMWKNSRILFEQKRDLQKRWKKDIFKMLMDGFVSKSGSLIKTENRLMREGKLQYKDRPSNLFALHGYMGQRLKHDLMPVQAIRDTLHNLNITDQDFDTYLFLKQTETNRAYMFNPLGFEVKSSREQLQYMESKLGPERYKALEKAGIDFAKWMLDYIMEPAVDLYGREKVDEWMDRFYENEEIWTPTLVQKFFLDGFVSARMIEAVGTVSPRMQPLTSLLLKAVAIRYATDMNNVKKALYHNVLSKMDSDVEKVNVYSGEGKIRNLPSTNAKGLRLMMFKENGVMKAVYADPFILDSIDNSPHEINNLVVSILGKPAQFFRAMFVKYRLSFQYYNIPRDFMRSDRNMSAVGIPMNVVKFTILALRQFLNAYDRATRRDNELITEMEKAGALLTSYGDAFSEFDAMDKYLRGAGKEIAAPDYVPAAEKENELLMKRFGVKKAQYKGIIGVLAKTMDSIRIIGDICETMSKAAAYEHIKKHYLGKHFLFQTPQDIAAFVRVYIGTPDFMDKGKFTPMLNTWFLFINVAIQGYRADLKLAFNLIPSQTMIDETGKTRIKPNTAFRWWTHLLTWQIIPKVLMKAARMGIMGGITGYLTTLLGGKLGLFDDYFKNLERMMRNIPERELANYYIIPLRMIEGKTMYFRFPMDESGRLISAIAWKAMRGKEFWKQAGDIFDYAAGQLPNQNPLIDIAQNWTDFARGKLPEDSYYNQPVMSEDEFTAGGWYSITPMLKWTAQKIGLPVPQTPKRNTIPAEHFIESHSWMGIKRAIRISNRGLAEEISNMPEISQSRMNEAVRRIETKRFMTEYVNKVMEESGNGKGLNYFAVKRNWELMMSSLTRNPQWAETNRNKTNDLMRTYCQELVKRKGNQWINMIDNAQTTREKAVILSKAYSELPREKFVELTLIGVNAKFISQETLQETLLILKKRYPKQFR